MIYGSFPALKSQRWENKREKRLAEDLLVSLPKAGCHGNINPLSPLSTLLIIHGDQCVRLLWWKTRGLIAIHSYQVVTLTQYCTSAAIVAS